MMMAIVGVQVTGGKRREGFDPVLTWLSIKQGGVDFIICVWAWSWARPKV